jgi:hypothetical protein
MFTQFCFYSTNAIIQLPQMPQGFKRKINYKVMSIIVTVFICDLNVGLKNAVIRNGGNKRKIAQD